MKMLSNIKKNKKPAAKSAGFTLIELILVLVIVSIICGISIPYFAGSLRGSKLRTAGRSISSAARYAHFMSIIKQREMLLVINPETLELIVGPEAEKPQNEANGELDQEAFKNLGYIEDTGTDLSSVVKTEVRRKLPEGLTIQSFENYSIDDEESNYLFGNLVIVHFFPNGRSESFDMELTDGKGTGLKIENDPISSKISIDKLQ